MTDQAVAGSKDTAHDVQRLKRNAVGTVGVIFMAVATAAPITAMVGNVPIAVGFGNGSHAPAGYIVATVVLGLFAVRAQVDPLRASCPSGALYAPPRMSGAA